MIASVSDLLEKARNDRTDSLNEMPVLYIVGDITQSITIDGSVVTPLDGHINGDDIYRICPKQGL